MANAEQLALLKAGVEGWNQWREEQPRQEVDLRQASLGGAQLDEANLAGADLSEAGLLEAHLEGANLEGACFIGADLTGAHCSRANLREAILYKASLNRAWFSQSNLREADLGQADLTRAYLWAADLTKANLARAIVKEANLARCNLSEAYLGESDLSGTSLREAVLCGADLDGADLIGTDLIAADLRKANLSGANLIAANLSRANLSGANLTNCNLIRAIISDAEISKSLVYGINVWDLEGKFKEQKELIITPHGKSAITVDNIKVAQFIYLIMNNQEVRDVINTLTSKTVLILGRFAVPERKLILDALRDKLREYDLLPIVFDFDRPTDKDFTETIKMLASLCYFVIADVTNPKSSPLELQATIPDYQIPFVPIIQEGEQPFAMMVDLQKKYNWVLDTLSYRSAETLIQVLKPAIIDPAIQKHNDLRLIKAREPKIRSAEDFIDKS